MQNNQSTHIPSIARILAALVYDNFLVFGLCCAATGMYLAVLYFVFDTQTQIPLAEFELKAGARLGLQLILLLCIYSFWIYFWTRHGQTLGMQTWKLRVVSVDGQNNLSFKQANWRFFGAVIAYGCCGLGLLWRLVDPHSRTWHDHLSNSQLIVSQP